MHDEESPARAASSEPGEKAAAAAPATPDPDAVLRELLALEGALDALDLPAACSAFAKLSAEQTQRKTLNALRFQRYQEVQQQIEDLVRVTLKVKRRLLQLAEEKGDSL